MFWDRKLKENVGNFFHVLCLSRESCLSFCVTREKSLEKTQDLSRTTSVHFFSSSLFFFLFFSFLMDTEIRINLNKGYYCKRWWAIFFDQHDMKGYYLAKNQCKSLMTLQFSSRGVVLRFSGPTMMSICSSRRWLVVFIHRNASTVAIPRKARSRLFYESCMHARVDGCGLQIFRIPHMNRSQEAHSRLFFIIFIMAPHSKSK